MEQNNTLESSKSQINLQREKVKFDLKLDNQRQKLKQIVVYLSFIISFREELK